MSLDQWFFSPGTTTTKKRIKTKFQNKTLHAALLDSRHLSRWY